MNNRSKIHDKPIKTVKIWVLGPLLLPSRALRGARTLPGRKTLTFEHLCAKVSSPGSLFGFPKKPKWLQNQPVEARSVPGPSKSTLLDGLGKNMKTNEKYMQKDSF